MHLNQFCRIFQKLEYSGYSAKHCNLDQALPSITTNESYMGNIERKGEQISNTCKQKILICSAGLALARNIQLSPLDFVSIRIYVIKTTCAFFENLSKVIDIRRRYFIDAYKTVLYLCKIHSFSYTSFYSCSHFQLVLL